MPHARSLHLTPIHQLVLFNSLQFVFTPTFNSVATYRYSNTVPRFGLVTVYNNISDLLSTQGASSQRHSIHQHDAYKDAVLGGHRM